MSVMTFWRVWARGALTPLCILAALAGLTSPLWPSAWPFLGDIGRMLDSLVFHLAAVTAALAFVLLVLGGRWIGGLGLGAAVLTVGLHGWMHLSRTLPLVETPPVLTVLWLNILSSNSTPPGQLAGALRDSSADLVLLGEADPIRGELAALADVFPYQLGCGGQECGVVLLSRLPLEEAEVRRTGWGRGERLVRVNVRTDGTQDLTVQGVHLAKPWFFGVTEVDDWHVTDQVGATTGPLLLLGDFNAAPWSKRLRTLTAACGLFGTRRPPATWPVFLGTFGVPIDLALTRGGARVSEISPWGAELGSNHRGILVRVAIEASAGDTSGYCGPIFKAG